MKVSAVLLSGAVAALGACDTYAPPPPQAAPMAPAANATLTTATKAPFGTYVVDGSGRSVYVLEGTRGMSGVNQCSGACLRVWPPVPARSPTPFAGSGLDPPALRTISGYTGAQISYSGWPLYYYHRDQAPGDTTGQYVRDQWGTWYLIRPSGEPIRPGY